MWTVIVRLFDAADGSLGPLHGVAEVPGGERLGFSDEATLVAAVLALRQRPPGDVGVAGDARSAPGPDRGDRTPDVAQRTIGPAGRGSEAAP